MSEAEHEHEWGSWKFGGYETDMRLCACGGSDYRTHQHNWNKSPDVFAPVGSGLTIEACAGPSGCGDTKRGK